MDEEDRPQQHFPDTYSIKAVGPAAEDFADFIVAMIGDIIDDADSIEHKTKASRTGAYTSVTASFLATSQQQLDEVFRQVSASERTVWVL